MSELHYNAADGLTLHSLKRAEERIQRLEANITKAREALQLPNSLTKPSALKLLRIIQNASQALDEGSEG